MQLSTTNLVAGRVSLGKPHMESIRSEQSYLKRGCEEESRNSEVLSGVCASSLLSSTKRKLYIGLMQCRLLDLRPTSKGKQHVETWQVYAYVWNQRTWHSPLFLALKEDRCRLNGLEL